MNHANGFYFPSDPEYDNISDVSKVKFLFITLVHGNKAKLENFESQFAFEKKFLQRNKVKPEIFKVLFGPQ